MRYVQPTFQHQVIPATNTIQTDWSLWQWIFILQQVLMISVMAHVTGVFFHC